MTTIFRTFGVVSTLLLLTACGGSGSENTTAETESVTGSTVTDSVDPGSQQTNINTEISNDNGTDTDADTGVTNEGTTNTSNSFCQPLTSQSITYEDYCGYGNESCPAENIGWFVPQPASGFSWQGQQLCDASASYGVDTVEVLVPYIASRPDVDGVSSYRDPQWANAVAAGTWGGTANKNDIDNLLVSPVPAYQDGSGYSTWRVSHDGTNLYIWVRVSNDLGGSVYADSDRYYNDDSVVIYIDGDNSKGDEYDGINDFVAIMLGNSNDWVPEIQSNSPDGLGLYYRTGHATGGQLLIYEIAINLQSAGIRIGQPFGFDVHINEDDNGGDRDAMWGWFEQSFRQSSWRDPSVLGTLLLTDCEDLTVCGRTQKIR